MAGAGGSPAPSPDVRRALIAGGGATPPPGAPPPAPRPNPEGVQQAAPGDGGEASPLVVAGEAAVPGGCCARLLPPGSLRGATFNLASATLGAGALSLPYAFRQSGLLISLAEMLGAALATVYSIRLLLRASAAASARHGCVIDSYEDLAAAIFGPRVQRVTEAMIILFCFGTAVAYCIAVGDILEPIRDLDGMPELLRGTSGRRLCMATFWALFMLPLSLLRSVSSLQFSSFLGVTAILFLVFATMYHCARHRFADHWSCEEMISDSSSSEDACNTTVEYTRLASGQQLLDTVNSLPLIMFAYCCQVNVYDIYRELGTPTEAKMMRVSWMGMVGLCFVIYSCMGIFGYLDFRADVEGNVLRNLQYDVQRDGVIAAAFVAITLTVVVAFPLVVFPTRESIFHILRAPATAAEREAIITQARDPRTSDAVERDYVIGPAARIRRVHSCPSFRTPPRGADPAQDSPGAHSGPVCLRHPFTPDLVPAFATPERKERDRVGSFHSLPFTAPENYYIPPQPTRVYRRPEAWRHYLVSLAISGSALALAVLIPNITVVFSFLGGVCASFLMFVLPAGFVRRLRADGEAEGTDDLRLSAADRVAIEVMFWGGCVAGVLSTGVTIYQTATGNG